MTIVCVNVTWWIADIPKLWQYGLQEYIEAVTWQCLRVSMPGVAGVFAIYRAAEPHDLPRLYYLGFHPGEDRKPLSAVDYAKPLITDTLTVVATCITIYKACNADTQDVSVWNVIWVYPNLPVALIGFWLATAAAMKLRNPWLIVAGGFLVLAVICVTITLIITYLSPAGGLWNVSLVLYIYLAVPIALLRSLTIQMFAPCLSVVARVLGVTMSALSRDAYFPFCELKNAAFGFTYLAFGILAALLAVYGRFKWGRVRYVFMPWQQAEGQPREDVLEPGSTLVLKGDGGDAQVGSREASAA